MSRLTAVLLALALAAGLAACGDDGESATTTTTEPAPTTTAAAPVTTAAPTTTVPAGLIQVTVAGGEVQGTDGVEEVPVGEQVTVEVTSDAADHVHVHGYDLFADVSPGTPARIEFAADIPGVFEVELEDSGRLLFELEVS